MAGQGQNICVNDQMTVQKGCVCWYRYQQQKSLYMVSRIYGLSPSLCTELWPMQKGSSEPSTLLIIFFLICVVAICPWSHSWVHSLRCTSHRSLTLEYNLDKPASQLARMWIKMAQTSEHPRSWWPDEMSQSAWNRPARGSNVVRKWTRAYVVDAGTHKASECLGMDWLLFLPKCEIIFKYS